MMVGVIHPAASIVREKEAGTIEQLQVTPIAQQEGFRVKTGKRAGKKAPKATQVNFVGVARGQLDGVRRTVR